MPRISVHSEIAALRRVLIHRPDDGIARVSPKSAEVLLFDDIVHLPKMKEEHDIFRQVLESFLGKNSVLEMEDLVSESFDYCKKDEKKVFLQRIVQFEELPDSYFDILYGLPHQELAEVLVTGYYDKMDFYLFQPIPNFIFTRDLAVTLKDHFLITKASKEARERENLLMRLVAWHHPIFAKAKKESRVINMNDVNTFPPSRNGEQVSIEGGDVMVIQEDYLMIGNSERTTEYAIESLKNVLFEKKLFKYIVQVNIPAERSYMHLDTLFTMIDKDLIVAHKPIIYDGKNSNVLVYSRDEEDIVVYNSVRAFFVDRINKDMDFVFGGNGESPYQEREQWTDGCNLVTLRPGVALSYDRNIHTAQAFRDKGYQVITAQNFLEKYRSEELDPKSIKKTIIAMPSAELSRARGGSHCMTCPIERI